MKKRILIFGLAAASLLSLASCSVEGFLKEDTAISYSDGSKLDYSISRNQYSRVKTYMTRLTNVVESGNLTMYGTMQINSYFPTIIDFLMSTLDARNKEYIVYSLDKSKTTAYYLELHEMCTTIYSWYQNFLKIASKNSDFRPLFGDMTDEEIESLVSDTESDKYYELSNQLTTYESEYESLTQSSSTFYSDSEEIYVKIINTCKEIATECGYDNYIDYAYEEVYSRDYTKEESSEFVTYVSNYIIPLLYDNDYKVANIKASLNESDYEIFKQFYTEDKDNSLELFNDYIETHSDETIKNNAALFQNGCAFYATKTNSYDGAYTTLIPSEDEAYCYFGTNYQDVFTIVHEFGHMNAMNYQAKNDYTSPSMDISETQSQGNELLFLKYIENTFTAYSDELKNSIIKYKLYDFLSTIVMATIMDEFERTIYASDFTAEAGKLDDVMIQVCDDKFGGYDKLKEVLFDPINYYHRAIITSELYYISYATSLIASLSLYEKAIEDYSNALSIYEKIYKIDSETYTFKTGLVNAGLSNPLSEETFEEIVKIFA